MDHLPRKLTDWTYDCVVRLLETHCDEGPTIEFKQWLSDQEEKLRISKVAAAMANRSGGFIVFGIADKSTGKLGKERVTGIPADKDIASLFYDRLKGTDPRVAHTFGVPILLPNQPNSVLHVVEILANGALHSVDGAFYRRRGSGTEPMTTDEIRHALVSEEEVRARFRLLLLELVSIREAALAVEAVEAYQKAMGVRRIDTRLLSQLQAELLPYLRERIEIIRMLTDVRSLSEAMNYQLDCCAGAVGEGHLEMEANERVRWVIFRNVRIAGTLSHKAEATATALAAAIGEPKPDFIDKSVVNDRRW